MTSRLGVAEFRPYQFPAEHFSTSTLCDSSGTEACLESNWLRAVSAPRMPFSPRARERWGSVNRIEAVKAVDSLYLMHGGDRGAHQG
jgi:hypothetical protein